MESPMKRKVTAKPNYNHNASSSNSGPSQPLSRTTHAYASRPTSPFKPQLSAQSSSSSLTVRPKAKVNSSATPNSATRKTPSAITRSGSSPSPGSNYGSRTTTNTTPRALSPARPMRHMLNGAPSPTFPSKTRAAVRTTSRPHTVRSTPGTPEFRPHSITAAASDIGPPNGARTRHGSVSLHHAASFSSLHRAATYSVSGTPRTPLSDHLLLSDHDGSGPTQEAAGTKIKAKVSAMAKAASDSLFPSPINSPTYPITSRTRAPSTSSNTSLKSSSPSSPALLHTFYPITTATAAANPHRFATTRTSPPTSSRHHYQPFSPPLNGRQLNQNKHNSMENVGHTTISVSPHSPPASAVSFSSRSSTSRSSVSYTAKSVDSGKSVPKHQNGMDSVGSNLGSELLDNLLQYGGVNAREENHSGDNGQDRETDGEADNEERNIKAEAKSIRKIADLEITNRSLLVINTSLETTKHRQAKEIRELRRKLRESRLILPPRAYRVVKLSLNYDDTADEDDEDDEDDEMEPKEGTGDEVYKRIKVILEGLLESGKRALEARPEDFSEGVKGVAKVLNAEEVLNWRGLNGVSDHEIHSNAGVAKEGDTSVRRPTSRSHVSLPDSDDDFKSEDEVAAMALPQSSSPSALILETESP